MSSQEKKLAAALASVRLYLQQDEEAAAAAQAAQAALALAPPVAPQAEPGQWAVSGRVEMMEGRRMMQLRAFR